MPEKQVTEWLETLAQKPSWRKDELPPEFTPYVLDALDGHGYVEAEIMLPDCRIRWFSPRQKPLEAGTWEVICADKEICGALSIRLTPVALRRLHDIELLGFKQGPVRPTKKKQRRRKRTKRTDAGRKHSVAYELHIEGYSYREIADLLLERNVVAKKPSPETVRAWVAIGKAYWEPRKRSVRAQKIPADYRGQETVTKPAQ